MKYSAPGDEWEEGEVGDEDSPEMKTVKKMIRSLVLPFAKTGRVAGLLNKDYKDIEGEWIPFRRLGFSDLESFLYAIDDTVRIRRVDRDGGDVLFVKPVSDESTDHIQDFVEHQRSRKRRKSGNKNNNQNNKNRNNNHNQNSGHQKDRTPQGRQPPKYNFKPRNKRHKGITGSDHLNAARHWNTDVPSSFDFNKTNENTPTRQPVDWPTN